MDRRPSYSAVHTFGHAGVSAFMNFVGISILWRRKAEAVSGDQACLRPQCFRDRLEIKEGPGPPPPHFLMKKLKLRDGQ